MNWMQHERMGSWCTRSFAVAGIDESALLHVAAGVLLDS